MTRAELRLMLGVALFATLLISGSVYLLLLQFVIRSGLEAQDFALGISVVGGFGLYVSLTWSDDDI